MKFPFKRSGMSPIVRPAGLPKASGSAGAVSGTEVDSSGSALRIDATPTPDATDARFDDL